MLADVALLPAQNSIRGIHAAEVLRFSLLAVRSKNAVLDSFLRWSAG